MKKQKRVFIDMDWVIARLTPKLLKYYNTIFNDNLKISDIKEWDLREAVKDDAKPYILNFFKIPGFYRDLEVVPGSQEVIKYLISEGYEVFILTDPFSMFSLEDKWNWLEDHFPFIPKENYIFAGNKGVVGDGILIDDAVHQLNAFNGCSILFDAPYNRHCKKYIRVHNWYEIKQLFDSGIFNSFQV